jgi:prephenate dehydratase
MTSIGYLGPQGTYSEEIATRLYAVGEQQRFRPFVTINAAIQAVAKGQVAASVVPIENSLEGSVNATLDMLAHEVNLYITAEIVAPIRHNLLVKAANKPIEIILSHPQALAQCRQTINRLYPGALLKAVDSTADAARLVAEGTGNWAAIGSNQAAKNYRLHIAIADLQDSVSNRTRFVCLEREQVTPVATMPYKTSVVCQINGAKPGSLCDILQEFATRGVNLTRIESRPARTGLGRYIFFLDIDGSIKDQAVQAAVTAIEHTSLWFKSLGTYSSVCLSDDQEVVSLPPAISGS